LFKAAGVHFKRGGRENFCGSRQEFLIFREKETGLFLYANLKRCSNKAPGSCMQSVIYAKERRDHMPVAVSASIRGEKERLSVSIILLKHMQAKSI
jgi:hypothetical protein